MAVYASKGTERIVESSIATPLTEAWYASGQRLGYDLKTRTIDPSSPHKVFVRIDGDVTKAVTFMPGYPDGSVGWAKVVRYLPDAQTMPKLFIEYVGMGDSDKPHDYRYSTQERADLVEAIWRYYGIKSTTLVSFDFSSLVILELLARFLERGASSPDVRGIFTFNGGLFTDGHSHPWFTTPVLRRIPVDKLPFLAKAPFATFKRTARAMWSKDYEGWENDARNVYSALSRNDGMFFLYRAADFVVAHKSQGKRLDFGRLYAAFHETIPFSVGGSYEDPFEHRQVTLAEQRLDPNGLSIARIPGGHLTTSEQPEALADLIADFYQRTRGSIQ